jgi:hypothetical protein
MGTMIAYDCQRVADCPRIDSLMTLGSPLGGRGGDAAKTEWSRDNGALDGKIASR